MEAGQMYLPMLFVVTMPTLAFGHPGQYKEIRNQNRVPNVPSGGFQVPRQTTSFISKNRNSVPDIPTTSYQLPPQTSGFDNRNQNSIAEILSVGFQLPLETTGSDNRNRNSLPEFPVVSFQKPQQTTGFKSKNRNSIKDIPTVGYQVPRQTTGFISKNRNSLSEFPSVGFQTPQQSAGFTNTPASKPCATPPIVKNFEIEKYIGRWFEIERFVNPFQTGDCVTADYGSLPNCSISVANSNVNQGRIQTIFGVAVSGPDPGKGELIVNFPGQAGVPPVLATEPNYGVVATDYKNYAVVYSCTTIPSGQKLEYSWILGRSPQVDPEFVAKLKQWLKHVGIESDRYQLTNQQNCFRRPFYAN